MTTACFPNHEVVNDISESPAKFRQYTLSFYLVLLFLVVPLWSSVPASWVFVTYALHTGKVWLFAWPGRTLFAVTLCEVLFSIYHYNLAQHVSSLPPRDPGDFLEIQAAYIRLLKAGLANLPEDGHDEESMNGNRSGSPAESIVQLESEDPRAIDFRHSLRTWFGKVPWSSVKLHEMRKFLYWSMYNIDLPPIEELSDSHRTVLDEALDLLQKRSGCRVTEGSDPTVQPMRLTIDQVNIAWRPFIYYFIISSVNWFLRRLYKNRWNAEHGSYGGLDYLVRVPERWDPINGPRPIVFIHGLGLGLLQYNVVLKHLFEKLLDRPILVPLQPQISQDIFHPRFLKPLTKHQTSKQLARLMNKFGWVHLDIEGKTSEHAHSEEEKEITDSLLGKRKGVTVLSHSNGSYTHAWLLKAHAEIIGRSCFVDPVTFCSWEGDVCYNFIYRPCRTGIELLMRYFVGNELGVANVLQRHFDWVSNSLWYEEIPNARDPHKTLFILGGKDDVINAERVRKYLTSHGIRRGLWYDPNGTHGQALITGGPGHAEILRWLQEPEH